MTRAALVIGVGAEPGLGAALCRRFAKEGLPVVASGRTRERVEAAPGRVDRVGPDGLLDPDAIADAYWHLTRQHCSAWTLELDLRPYRESF